MHVDEAIQRGRASFQHSAWSDVYTTLSGADRRQPLEYADLELLAIAASLTGRDEESAGFWVRAHQECLRLGHMARAARCAFWIGLALVERGEMAQGGGWLGRAERLLEQAGDCVERGYLLLPQALQRLGVGDCQPAYGMFVQAGDIAARFNDIDLITLARLGQGRSLIGLGRAGAGTALLDEAMVAVMADRVSPTVTGIVYCAVIEACQEIFDVARAREWTAALYSWCEKQPDLELFRGQCLVYRAELMQLQGEWQTATAEARRAQLRLTAPADRPVAGEALYREAELHRLRGEYAEAEAAYREASERGRQPEPGLALLRLAQGQTTVADATSRRALDEAQGGQRTGLLGAHVEIMLAVGDLEAARASVDELASTAIRMESAMLRAQAAGAEGAVRLAGGDARGALDVLRKAWTEWQGLEAPFEAARVRVLIGVCCRLLGDEEAAQLEIAAARSVFEQLGAQPDALRAQRLTRSNDPAVVGGLTERELEVLRLVASGKSNRTIAADLVISEKTVARHLSNIYTKLGLSSRSAATAYAYEHDLLVRPT